MNDEDQILLLFEDGDRALLSTITSEIERIYSADYIQYDESGAPSSRAQLIANLTSGSMGFLSMKSTGRRVRILRDDFAVVHGSEEDEIEKGGKRSIVRYIYMDVVAKRDGRWQIVASQLATPTD
jgi:hypothetical protein